ncbi:MAG: DUF6390 family protein [Egibacteraceae bacterium]
MTSPLRQHADGPLRVFDQCRIRWGRVVLVAGGEVVVRSRPLRYESRQLSLGPSGPRPRPQPWTASGSRPNERLTHPGPAAALG